MHHLQSRAFCPNYLCYKAKISLQLTVRRAHCQLQHTCMIMQVSRCATNALLWQQPWHSLAYCTPSRRLHRGITRQQICYTAPFISTDLRVRCLMTDPSQALLNSVDKRQNLERNIRHHTFDVTGSPALPAHWLLPGVLCRVSGSICSTAYQDSKLRRQWPEPTGNKLGGIGQSRMPADLLAVPLSLKKLDKRNADSFAKIKGISGFWGYPKRQMQPCLRHS